MESSPAYFAAASVTKKKIGFIKSEPDRGEQPSALRLGVSVIKLFLRLFANFRIGRRVFPGTL
jgi:hypothetical protein